MKHKQIRRTFFLLLFSFIISIYSFSQVTNSGTDFYVAFGKNDTISYVSNNKNVELILRIASLNDADVTLSFKDNPALDTVISVEARKIFDYHLTQAQTAAAYSIRMTSSSSMDKKSVRITSTRPITVVAMNSVNHSVEATLVWPVESWGREYYNNGVTHYYNLSSGRTANCNGYLLIAKENDTRVTQTNYSGNNQVIIMNEGETFHFYAANTDFYWAHIESDKPIAFFNTNTLGSITTGGIAQSNYIFEQIMPVNQWGTKFIGPTNSVNAALFRISTKEIPNTITVTYSDNTKETINIIYNANSDRYRYITIDATNHSGAKACYITSEKPIAVCAFEKVRYPGISMSQPAFAWLPPLEQRSRGVLISPLDFNGEHVYLHMDHFVTIIVKTASKEITTIMLNGGDEQPIQDLPDFEWLLDNVGGSGYSIGRYLLGTSDPINNIFLGVTAYIDNSDGLIALACGHGSYTNYYYAAGSAYRDLTAGFTVNNNSYIDMDWNVYCDVSNFTLKAYPDTLTNIVWKINGETIGSGLSITTDLQDGFYTADMIVHERYYTTHFYVGGSPVVWTPNQGSKHDKHDWDNYANWTPAVVPTACHIVFIPGNSSHYPNLTKKAECKSIYFMQGGELGHPELLTYKKAFIQYNFGLKQTDQITDENDKDLVLKSSSTTDRLLYSAAVSADPIKRERWYMLSSPLKDVVTGDLGFGGFPLTFLRKFDPVKKGNQNYVVGNWTTSFNSLVEPVVSNITDGFAFFMYGYGMNGSNNTGCEESGYYGQMNELDYLPANRSDENYGIKETNGILELPFFTDSTKLYAHRTQIHNPSNQQSTFYYTNDGKNDMAVFNYLFGTKDSIIRKTDDDNHRFAPETLNGSDWTFTTKLEHPVTGLESGDEFLVGNPYMSSIDMVEFCKDNASSIYPAFKIWNGIAFDSYSVNTSSGEVTPVYPATSNNMRYISPLQGFFLTYTGSGTVVFDVTKISTVRPARTPFNLRSAEETAEENLLRIKAENNSAVSYAVIGYREGASNDFINGEDVQKLFSPYDYVPEIYSLAGEIPVDMNFIRNNGEVIVPLGIKTDETGEIRLTFTGMDNYFKASKIEFIDVLENQNIDLTEMSSYTYTFNHTETGINNGRFLLKISSSITSLPDINNNDDLKVYGDSKGIYVISSETVKKLEIYDLTGKKIYENNSDARYYPLNSNMGNIPMIVKVMTGNQVKTVKVK